MSSISLSHPRPYNLTQRSPRGSKKGAQEHFKHITFMDLFTNNIDAWVARKSRELLEKQPKEPKQPINVKPKPDDKKRDTSFEVSKVLRAFNDYERQKRKAK